MVLVLPDLASAWGPRAEVKNDHLSEAIIWGMGLELRKPWAILVYMSKVGLMRHPPPSQILSFFKIAEYKLNEIKHFEASTR